MKVPFVDLSIQYESIKEELEGAFAKVFEQSQFIGGDPVRSFEKEFADYLGVEYCISCGNGTDALEIALKALGVGSGDEVIVPANSWISTAEAVSNVGGNPIFIDVSKETYNLDLTLLPKVMTEKTKGIIAVHLAGCPADLPEIMDFAEDRDLFVVEDCAQAHGASIAGKKVGAFGDVAAFSFYPTKNLGAYGDAGAVVTENDDLAERIRRLSNHGALNKHDHLFPGRNSGLDTLQAAFLSTKLKYLDTWNEKRRQIARWYQEYLPDQCKYSVPRNNHHHVYHLMIIEVEERNDLQAFLKEKGVQTSVHYPTPIPHTDAYASKMLIDNDYAVSRRLSNHSLSLPMFPELSVDQVRYVCASISEFYN